MSPTELLLGGLLAAVGYFLGFVLPAQGKARGEVAVASHTYTHELTGLPGEFHEHTYSAKVPAVVRRMLFRRDSAGCIGGPKR
ncbi:MULTISPECIES: hypothetical protein [unclassified Salinibacterium]|uniref:hypothetical protein n=1 Tax=unclassified Salinibacterium TaxID=2632331 RepID=UPI001422E90B|nr:MULTISPECIES: hypothetical protein [unclassified Salinibacterium]